MYRCVVVPLEENEDVKVTDNRILRKYETRTKEKNILLYVKQINFVRADFR